MEGIPTVENGGLIKTEHPNIFKIGKCSDEFNKFLVDAIFHKDKFDTLFCLKILYFNNIDHIVIARDDMDFKNSVIRTETFKCFVTICHNEDQYTVIEVKPNEVKCCCGNDSLLYRIVDDKRYDFCSVNCENKLR